MASYAATAVGETCVRDTDEMRPVVGSMGHRGSGTYGTTGQRRAARRGDGKRRRAWRDTTGPGHRRVDHSLRLDEHRCDLLGRRPRRCEEERPHQWRQRTWPRYETMQQMAWETPSEKARPHAMGETPQSMGNPCRYSCRHHHQRGLRGRLAIPWTRWQKCWQYARRLRLLQLSWRPRHGRRECGPQSTSWADVLGSRSSPFE